MKKVLLAICLCSTSAFAQTPPATDNTVANDVGAVINACNKLSTDLTTVQTDIKAVQAAGGVVLPNAPQPVPPPGPTESADGTQVTPGNGTIYDASLTQWTLNSGTFIQRNGVNAYNGWQSKQMVYHNHLIFILGLDGNWYSWNGTAFIPASKPI